MNMDERTKVVKERKGCFKCLKVGHIYLKCRSKERCPWCGKRHSLLVKISGPKGKVDVRAVIDTGSHRSYILEGITKTLGYEVVGEQTMIHLLFGGSKTKPQRHKACRIYVTNLDGTYKCDFVALQQSMKHPLLIEADIAGKILTGKVLQIDQGITALETKLGWTFLGREFDDNSESDAALIVMSMLSQEANVSDLWRLDTLGITDPIEKTTRVNEEGRYEVLLPWKENHPPLQDNRDVAEKRLKAVTKKLRHEDLFEDYNTVLNNWLAEGIIERVPTHEVLKKSYYLPHRPVVKKEGTTRIRPVFDASAKTKNSPSLNQCLETGPNLIEHIPALLHRFRERKIGVTADITKAFLQINISSSDRDVLKFLWWSANGELETYRHRRVVFGVTSSPYLLGVTIDMHIKRALQANVPPCHKSIYEKLAKSFNVDDCVTSVDSHSDFEIFQKEASFLLNQAKFDLRGWKCTGMNSENRTTILGLVWDTKGDTLSFSFTSDP
ncbi:PREDICTED: uncharacterized protein LOC108779233 [Cyphomyrmex costatus]|uniref:uncharacterized protein LOC108779233 n=1 Tax=Cyphomyrmex costatus TaxID=456900 RepID=UPI0008524608|nr:PREDICTED: uncharacterized protein LOC108779233 [Cyphomyrmex costatus]